MRLLLVVTALLIALSSHATPSRADHYITAGHIYLSFDPDARVAEMEVTPGIPFQIYIVVDVGSISMTGVEGSLAFGPLVNVLGITWPTGALDIGPLLPPRDGFTDFAVGLGSCVDLGGGSFALGVVTAMLVGVGTNITIGVDAVGPAGPSSVHGDGAAWVDCSQPEFLLYKFEEDIVASSVVINPSPTPTTESNWGRIKTLFR